MNRLPQPAVGVSPVNSFFLPHLWKMLKLNVWIVYANELDLRWEFVVGCRRRWNAVVDLIVLLSRLDETFYWKCTQLDKIVCRDFECVPEVLARIGSCAITHYSTNQPACPINLLPLCSSSSLSHSSCETLRSPQSMTDFVPKQFSCELVSRALGLHLKELGDLVICAGHYRGEFVFGAPSKIGLIWP